ncbi:uroporphyrinogen decarboxylase family protein [Limosilactobacillus sp.]|uniref:uroporphyrinogen decarboxylase family protein n=1 Tax=Limosilactobacillus sp. TaxID=2773925 RepID=UPI003F0D8551
MSLSRETVLKALHNESVDQVPASFWRHFADNEFTNAATTPSVLTTNLTGHRDYYQEVDVDFAKTMLDGYFPYPFHGVADPKNITDLHNLRPIEDNDPWLTGQVALASKQKQLAGDRPTFVTMFSPLFLLKWALIEHYQEPLLLADKRFADMYEQDPQLILHVLKVISDDQKKVARALMTTGIDGIYYSTQEIQDERTSNPKFFEEVMEPIDIDVQNAINAVSPLNILHICGFDGADNHLDWFVNYPLQVINWATETDGYSLAAGKKLFGDRPVMGGLDNSTKGILYSGTKQQIQDKVHELLSEAGNRGVLLGADCTVPRDIDYDHLRWAIEAAHN